MSAAKISRRLDRGLSPSEATDPAYQWPHSRRRGKPITINETTLDTLGWAKRCGVTKQRMQQLLSRYPPEIAVLPKHERLQLWQEQRRARRDAARQVILAIKTEIRAKRMAAGAGARGRIAKRIVCGNLVFTAKEWAVIFEVSTVAIYKWDRLGVLGKRIATVNGIAERLQIAEAASAERGGGG